MRFNYTGGIQTYTITEDGYYKLEVFGSRGANGTASSGGKGGYASGIKYLEAGTTLYIACGGQNYNGGGTRGTWSSQQGGVGGGATHIATISGTLSSIGLSNIDKVLIIAGGGGGGSGEGGSVTGGAGGGLSGGNTSAGATGGSQSSGGRNEGRSTNGSFGQGGNNNTSDVSGGGGGGYYGGGGGTHAGAGGSSFIDNVLFGYTESGKNDTTGYAIINKLLVNPTNAGSISATNDGSSLSLYADANGGYDFDYWELDGYTRLDYIESTGTQYIDTGVVVGAKNTKVECGIQYTQLISDSRIFSTFKNSVYFQSGIGSSGNFFGQVAGAGTYQSINGDTNRHTITLDNNTGLFQVDEQSLTLTTSTTNLNNTLPLFCMLDNSTYKNYAKAKMDYCKIYTSNVLVRDYIPIKRNSDGAIGLFDLIEMKFYANKGSGTFAYGQELGTITFNDNPLILKVGSDVDLIAHFKNRYQITLTYDSSLGSANYTWTSGTQIELVATPNANAQFIGWYINSNPIGTTETLTYMPLADTTIEARFGVVYQINESVVGNGSLQYTRGSDKNDVTFSVIADTNNHFVRYVIDGVEYTTTPLSLHLTQAISIVAYFEENERYHIDVSSSFPYATFYISDNDVFSGTYVTIWARPFPDYNFVRWADGSTENPRQILVTSDVTMTAEYQRIPVTNGIYQYRCYVKDQLDLTAPPKAFMIVDDFDVKTDNMTNANSTIYVLETSQNINNGDILVVYDPFGNNLYQGVIKSIDVNKIQCSQMQSFYKGLWVYNISPQDYLEHEIAVLLQDYADGKIYKSTYVDNLVAQRLGGITIDYVGSTIANLPSDLDDNGNEKLTQKDMEQFIYELYADYGILFDFEINFSGANYVHIKVPSYTPIKVGNNMYAISNMSPITQIEETNRLIIFAQNKTYRTTYVATKTGIVEEPSGTNNRFDITNTKIVFSDDSEDDLVAQNLPSQMYNHKLTFTLIIKNFIYEFGDFNLGGELEVWFNDDYYDTILTGYQIKKKSNQNITQVDFVCGKVRTALTKQLTRGVI